MSTLFCKAVLTFLKFCESGGFLSTAATYNFTNGITSSALLITEEFSTHLIAQNLKGNDHDLLALV